jgi:hypothetical protein
VKIFSSKRRVAAAVVVILLGLWLLRPGASRLKSRIITSISLAVGRPVDIASVHVQLLPRPGFDLENLVVYDDAEFGAEPILRAGEVSASLRLTSLLRGRMEIARLELTEPSLNLVHSDAGRWNLEALLERTSHIPTAPTSKAKSEPRPGFPYIVVTGGRLNFKDGAEKKPYTLTNADFTLWQESENSWGVRLTGQPVRTDINLSDTGLLRINGTWQRAQVFRDTPLRFNVEWSRAQLGQFTKLFTGNDKGWRGEVHIQLTMAGTPAKLHVTSSASVDDFRRYDITNGRALRLAGSCDGEYSSLTHEFDEIACSAPVANGMIALTGNAGLPGSHRYTLRASLDKVPASAVVSLAERAKKSLPDDLVADGTLQGNFWLQSTGDTRPIVEGTGEIADFQLASAGNKAEVGPVTLPFSIVSPADTSSGIRKDNARATEGPRVEFGPMVVGGTRAGAATVRGWAARSGYSVAIAGETEIARALRLARMMGIPALPTAAEGSALVDLQVAGSWLGDNHGGTAGFAPPEAIGTAKLRNIQVPIRGAAGPLEISSAEMQLASDRVRVTKLNAKAGGAVWTGSLDMPRGCAKLEACPVHFTLNANELSISDLNEWANPGSRKRAWYQVLESNTSSRQSPLANLRANGHVTVGRLLIRKIAATRVSAKVALNQGKLQISELSSEFFGGTHRGEWQADFTVKPAACKGNGTFTDVSLFGLTEEMKDDWIAGTAGATYEIKGPCLADFWQSSEGTLRVEMRDGVLPHLMMGNDAQALRVTHTEGQAHLQAGKIEISNAKLDSPGGKYLVTGTATLKKEIDLKLEHEAGAGGYTVTGTLAEPQVAPFTEPVQANLKTDPAK